MDIGRAETVTTAATLQFGTESIRSISRMLYFGAIRGDKFGEGA
jgi:hypothetical protein